MTDQSLLSIYAQKLGEQNRSLALQNTELARYSKTIEKRAEALTLALRLEKLHVKSLEVALQVAQDHGFEMESKNRELERLLDAKEKARANEAALAPLLEEMHLQLDSTAMKMRQVVNRIRFGQITETSDHDGVKRSKPFDEDSRVGDPSPSTVLCGVTKKEKELNAKSAYPGFICEEDEFSGASASSCNSSSEDTSIRAVAPESSGYGLEIVSPRDLGGQTVAEGNRGGMDEERYATTGHEGSGGSIMPFSEVESVTPTSESAFSISRDESENSGYLSDIST